MARPAAASSRLAHEPAGVAAAIGNTPLIRLNGPSERTGCEILAKAEFLNPGGSVKDRTALGILTDALASGALRPGGLVVEGTAGNTGIGLTLLGNALGLRTIIVMPDTQSEEKQALLRLLGADLRLVPAAPYKDAGNYVRVSERLAGELAERASAGVLWANQWDNPSNWRIHYKTTGREIWQQTHGRVDGFICAMGTGGTLAGVSRYLKEKNPTLAVGLADPMGAAMHAWFTTGKLESEGRSITEGIGQSRVTLNVARARVDQSFQIPDEEALPVLFDLLAKEGLCVGGSSAINVAGAIRLAEKLGPGHTVVTVLCDSGERYRSRLFNPEFLTSRGLPAPPWLNRVPGPNRTASNP